MANEGIAIDSLPVLATFDPSAVFYTVVNDQDYQISGAQLLTLLAQNLSADQLPNVVTTETNFNTTLLADQSFAAVKESVLERLTSNRTYFVRKDGNDAHSGLTDTADGAFLTIQHAIDVASKIDFNNNYNFTVTINVGSGVYEEGLVFKSLVGTGNFEARFLKAINIIGNLADPSTVTLKISGYYGILASGPGCDYLFRGFTMDSTTAPNYAEVVIVAGGASIFVGNLRVLTNSGVTAFHLVDKAKLVYVWSNFELFGSCKAIFDITDQSNVEFNMDVFTLTGNPVWGKSCFEAKFGSIFQFSYGSIIGTATGKRFSAAGSSGFNSYGGGLTYAPGSIAGTLDSTSYYY